MRMCGWSAVVLAVSVASPALAQDSSSGEAPSAQASQPQDSSVQPSAPPPAPIDLIAPQPKEEKKEEAPAATGPGGFELGLRIVAELPLGDTFKGTSLKSMVAGQAAAQLDLGWRIDPRWEVGAFVRYGLAFVNGCTKEVSCSSHDVGLGLEGQLHLAPGAWFDPWLGLGVGYEFLTLSSNGAATPPSNVAVETTVTYKGLTYAAVNLGADYRLSDVLGGGPYVEFSAGQFASTQDTDLTNKSLHLWLGLGLRGWFDLR